MTMLDFYSSIKPSENKKLPRYLVLDDRIIARSSDINSADLPALVRENEEKNRFIGLKRDWTMQRELSMSYSKVTFYVWFNSIRFEESIDGISDDWLDGFDQNVPKFKEFEKIYVEVLDRLKEKVDAYNPIPLKALELVSIIEFINLLKYLNTMT